MVVDTGMRASLVEAGLVDPASGEFTSAPNFGGPAETESPRMIPDVPDDKEAPGAPGDGEVPAQPNQLPASQPQVQPSPSAPSGSPDPENGVGTQDASRLGAEADPVRQKYETTVAQMNQQAEMAFHYGRTLTDEEGKRVFTDDQLATQIGRELQYAQQQAFLSGVMERMQPVAQRAAAEKIAKEHGVDVEDIVNESSPVAMQATAATIAKLKRDGRFQERKAAATDQAEGSRGFSSAIPDAIDKLTPQQKMYVGFARGDH